MTARTATHTDDGRADPQRLRARRRRDARGRGRSNPADSPVHHLLDDGSFAITVPCDGLPVGNGRSRRDAQEYRRVLEMTDYAPLPLREPVRSLVWIRGRLHDVPAGEVAALLDLIAAEDPNPALLQVNSGRRHATKATPATR